MITDRAGDPLQCFTCANYVGDETGGQCRAAPPQVLERIVPGEIAGTAKAQITGHFPPVRARIWCGCHRRDPERQPLPPEEPATKPKSRLILPPAANGGA